MSFAIYMLWKTIKKHRVRNTAHSTNKSQQLLLEQSDLSSYLSIAGADNHEEGSNAQLFNLISAATDEFSESNKLGEGGFGPVYRARLPSGQQIAVKRLSKKSRQGLTEFKNEVELISNLQHRNLVRLFGCCIHEEEKLLLYELLPNKSLDAFIFGKSKNEPLDWNKRYNIIEGIARGLLYLHRDSRLKIIHRDLKASNVLLDEQFNPKISDFGMARLFHDDQDLASTGIIVGTIGYMSPEYTMNGQFSEKSDVYSFGVLIIEIVSGKRNNFFIDEDQALNLLFYARKLWQENRAEELVDPSLGDSWPQPEVLKCIKLGLLCAQDSAAERPSMASVVSMLSTQMDLPPTTTTTAGLFRPIRFTDSTGLTNVDDEQCSASNLSNTGIESR